MSCAGKQARIIAIEEGQTSTVYPFDDSMRPSKGIRTVHVAYAYDAPNGQTAILQVNHCLDFTSTMENSIVCTNQARANNIIVNDCPKLFDLTHTSTQSVIIPDNSIEIPIHYHGPVPYIPIRYPTDEDLDGTCPTIHLTAEEGWNMDLVPLSHHVSSYSSETELDAYLLKTDLLARLHDTIHLSGITHNNELSTKPEILASMWDISLENARRTIDNTTQRHVRLLSNTSVYRRFKTLTHQRQYRQLGGYLGKFASDTFKAKIKSTRGNLYAQLFCNRGNFTHVVPIPTKSSANAALDQFLHHIGIPNEMLTDGALELTKSDWGRTCIRHSIIQNTTEPHTPKINPAESQGGLLKRKIRDVMRRTNTPVRLWDYAWEYISGIRSLTATNHIQNNGVTPFEMVMGYTPNISEFIQHKWFDWVWFNDPDDPDKQRLGRWLGPAHSVGQGMAFYVLTNKGNVMTRSTVVSLSHTELETAENVRRMKDYTTSMESVIGNYSLSTSKLIEYKTDDPYTDVFVEDAPIEEIEYVSPNNSPYHDDFVNDSSVSNDKILGMKLSLPHGGEQLEGRIVSRKRDSSGNLIGTHNNNPSQDTREYNVEFGNGDYGSYAANTIIENLHAQVDDYGQTSSLLQGIINFRITDTAIPKSRGWTTLPSGVRKRKVTTKGVDLEVEYADGSTSWVPLKDLKESNPIETAEFAVSRNIQDEPAFAWWVTHVLRKRAAIIKRVNARTAKKNMKFGILIPDNIAHAIQLDTENGNKFWEKSIEKEVSNVKIALLLLEHDEPIPVGSKHITYHFIFDVKFDLTRKARCVAGGHQNKNIPAQCTYASVVSRDSVRIAFLLAALNEVDILAGDIGNAYLNAPCKERVHVTITDDILFGAENKGKTAVIVRALYGLKSAGNSWRQHFATKIREELGYVPCVADQDVHMKEATKPDGTKYWAYIIVYVDDVLVINHNAKATMNLISNIYRMKDGSIETPKVYLGANIKEWNIQDPEGQFDKCYALSSETYTKEAIRVVNSLMLKHKFSYSSTRRHGSKSPFSSSEYRPELESSQYCSDKHTTIYQNLMGMLRWMCELGRIDILHEASLLSQYMSSPRQGHLQQAFNVFYYLNHNLAKGWLIFDPLDYDINWVPIRNDELHPQKRAEAMKELYPDAEDLPPPKMPLPRGKPVNINVFVDSDHAGNTVTRRSHTGIMIFINMAPIQWYSKKQNTVETSTFGAEFIALKIATELIESLQYKLRMMGVQLSGPARVMCDNQSVVISGSFPESTLKKKHCSIAYHKVREAVAAEKILIYYENTDSNIADLFTKVLTANKRWPLIQGILS